MSPRTLGLAVLLASCVGGDDTDDAFCAEAPVVTYASFGQDFLRENCQSCHASTSDDRNGAPPNVVFDTEDDAWMFRDRILALAASDTPSMPPQGGVEAEDREKLEIWLRCDAPVE